MGPRGLSSFVVGVRILELNSPLLLLLLFLFGVFVFLGEIKNVGMLGKDLGIWRWFSWVIFLLVENYVWDFSGYWNLVEMLLLLGKRGTKDIVYVW